MRIFFLSVIFCFLAFLALIPLIIVTLSSYEGGLFESLQYFFTQHSGVIVSLSTLFLVSGLALLATHLANSSAERLERQKRKLSAEIKLAEFRQDWINRTRDDFALLFAELRRNKNSLDGELQFKLQRIVLSLNPKEKETKRIYALMKDWADSSDAKASQIALNVIATKAGEILKIEWDRLRADLEGAQDIGRRDE
jgi:hypothetical protein